jgi:hypothetical protein
VHCIRKCIILLAPLVKGARALKLRLVLLVAVGFVLLPVLSWAGSFYANITIVGTNPDAVVDAAKDMGLIAIVVLGKPDAAVICEKTMDSQDDVYGRNLAKKLSKSLESVAVYVLNHDSKELSIATYAYGEKVFEYDSSPGAGNSSSIQGLEDIESTFPSADVSKLRTVLEGKYASADDRQVEIWNLFALPYNVPGLGYRNLMDAKSRSEIGRRFGFQFVEVD